MRNKSVFLVCLGPKALIPFPELFCAVTRSNEGREPLIVGCNEFQLQEAQRLIEELGANASIVVAPNLTAQIDALLVALPRQTVEVYVVATAETVSGVHDLVNARLKVSGFKPRVNSVPVPPIKRGKATIVGNESELSIA